MPACAIGIVYFLWVGIFNVMVIAQFWAFANDLYTPGAGQAPVSAHRRGQFAGRMARRSRGKEADPRAGPYGLMTDAAHSC